MENGCTPKCKGGKLLAFGAVLILVRLYTTWDIWVVIGAMVMIKGLMMLFMPCPCNTKPKGRK